MLKRTVATAAFLILCFCPWCSHSFQIETLPPIAATRRRLHRIHVRPTTTPLRALPTSLFDPVTMELLMSTTTTSSSSALLSSAATAALSTVSPEPIHTAFSVATFLPQNFYILLVLFPNAKFTKQLLGDVKIPVLLALLHLFIVIASIVLDNAATAAGATAPLSEFNDVFDPFGDPQAAFGHMVQTYPNFVAEEWSHVLTWDFFVAWWIWRDGVRRNIFTSHSVLLCNLIGPPGLLLHWVTCLLTGNSILNEDDKIKAD